MMKITSIMLFLLGTMSARAQVSVHAAGGDAASETGSVSHSIGQVFYTVDTGNGSAAKGVQHPLIVQIVGVHSPGAADPQISVFPNPVASSIFIAVGNDKLKRKLSFFLYSSDNRLVGEGKITDVETEIAFRELASGVYFLVIKDAGAATRAFKIIKVH